MTAMSFSFPMYSDSILLWSLRLLLFHTSPCRSHSESRAFRAVHPTPCDLASRNLPIYREKNAGVLEKGELEEGEENVIQN